MGLCVGRWAISMQRGRWVLRGFVGGGKHRGRFFVVCMYVSGFRLTYKRGFNGVCWRETQK